MELKYFFAKLFLGRDINEELVVARKERSEAQDKYNNTCQTISMLEEKISVLSESLDRYKQELSSLQSEKKSADALLSQLLNDEELDNAKTILESRLDGKSTLLESLTEKQHASLKEHVQTLAQLRKLQEEKTSLEKDVDDLTNEAELLKEKSEQRENQKAVRENLIAQRKEIRDNLSTLKNEWKETLDDFKTRVVDVENQKSLEALKRKLKDYERRVNNAIEISVK